MQPISAISLAPDVNDWLANSRHPRILHIFDYVCNLINEHGEVLSIVTLQIGNGPFNLVVENDVLFSEYLAIQSPVSILGNQLTLGELTICTAGSKLWSPRPNWGRLHHYRDFISGGLMSCLSSWKLAKADSTTVFNPKLLITNYGFDNSLLSALALADLPASITATKKLAGLGIGLTPAGDDFIMGAIYAVWLIHPHRTATVFAREIAESAALLTTSLSAAWLRSSGRGKAGILWHEFFDALLTGSSSDIQLQITKLLSVGETSGTDALAGFIGTFRYWEESVSSKIS